VNLDDCIETVRATLDGGINLIERLARLRGDTCGNQLRKGALNGIPRNRYYLATKVGAYSEAKGDYDYSAERTERSLRESPRAVGRGLCGPDSMP
jgi:L-galactose dehydrogenase